MKELNNLLDRIIDRVNVNLREPKFDVRPFARNVVPNCKFTSFYAFYGVSRHHCLDFEFKNSSLAGSYFLGRCQVENSVIYKTDVRGDELKSKGSVFTCGDMEIPLHDDEAIVIKDSFLIKTLVHNFSHDPEFPELFPILNTVSMHYANIHGAPIDGSFVGSFATVDLTSVHDCVIGSYAYIQTGELSHAMIKPGQILIKGGDYSFEYLYEPKALKKYVNLQPGKVPEGILMDFVEEKKDDFQRVFEHIPKKSPVPIPKGSALSRYSVVEGDTRLAENVLVAQRAYLRDAWMGVGANAQENCYIVNSMLEGYNVTAHGGKIINARLGQKVFVGFNSFVRGLPEQPLLVGKGSVIMPHTIIDLEEPVEIPAGSLVWGYISKPKDLEQNSMPLKDLASVQRSAKRGRMKFKGDGKKFVEDFSHRIDHILEANGAFHDGKAVKGHAQMSRNINFNTIQPYPEGPARGLYPTISIKP